MKSYRSGGITRIVPPNESDSELSPYSYVDLSFTTLTVGNPGDGDDLLSCHGKNIVLGHRDGFIFTETVYLHKLYLFGGQNRRIDLRKLKKVCIHVEFDNPLQVNLSPCGRFLAVRGKNHVGIYSLSRGEGGNFMKVVRSITGNFQSFQWSPNCFSFFTLGDKLTIYADPSQKGVEIPDPVSAASWSPIKDFGRNLLVSDKTGTLRMFRVSFFDVQGVRRVLLKLKSRYTISTNRKAIENIKWINDKYVLISVKDPLKQDKEERPAILKVDGPSGLLHQVKVFEVLGQCSSHLPRRFRSVHLDCWSVLVLASTDSSFVRLFEEYQKTYYPLIVTDEDGDFDLDDYCRGLTVDYTFCYPLDWKNSPVLMFMNDNGELHLKHIRYTVDELPKEYPLMKVTKKTVSKKDYENIQSMNKWLMEPEMFEQVLKHYSKVFSYARETRKKKAKKKTLRTPPEDFCLIDIPDDPTVDSLKAKEFWGNIVYTGKK